MFVRMGDLCVHDWLGIVESVPVDVLVGTSFTDRCIRGTFPMERKIIPWHSRRVSVLMCPLNISNLFLIVQVLHVQTTDAFCRQAFDTVGIPGSAYSFDHNGYVVRTFPIDGTTQKVVPTSLQPCVLYLSQYLDWLVTPVKDPYTIPCEASFLGHT